MNIKIFLRKLSFFRQKLTLKKKNYQDLIAYFKNPPKETIDGLNVSPKRYARPELKERSKFLHEFLQSYIDPSDKILELGCGVCRNLNYLAERGYKDLHGIEINSEAVSLSTQLYSSLLPFQDNIKCQSLENGLKEYSDKQFDLIFSMCTLMHIHSEVEKGVFSEISRISKIF